MIRDHDVRQLTTAELERTKRELRANLALITPHSPAHVPIQAHMTAIDAELAERAVCRETRRPTEVQPFLPEPSQRVVIRSPR